MGAILVIAGATTAVLGRHSILGFTIGCGLMLVGWFGLEIRREAKR